VPSLCSIGFRTDGSYVEVVDVSLGKPDVNEDDETAYAGPVRALWSNTSQAWLIMHCQQRLRFAREPQLACCAQ
jgi:hypothetical protein